MSVAATTQSSNPPLHTASASLYVGDLSPDVPEGKLYEIFNNIGQVQSVRVLRDHTTRRSLGYAYVNFHRVDDAEKALDTMNYALINDRPCRIMWSQRDPNLRKSGKGNIFIKNLAKKITHADLRDTLSHFGTILSCKVALNSKGESLGYGFVHFAAEADAAAAVANMNNCIISPPNEPVLPEHKVTVAPFVSADKRKRTGFTNVFYKNIPRSFTQEDIDKMFSEFGVITSRKLVVTSDEKKACNFGFVNFDSQASAKAAVDGLNNKQLGDKRLYVGPAQKNEERQKELKLRFDQLKQEKQAKYTGFNLYVKNLSDHFDDAKLNELFGKFGPISSGKVMVDKTTAKSKGFGFVCYEHSDHAMQAVQQLNGQMYDGKPLYVAMAQRMSERRGVIEANIMRRSQRIAGQAGAVPYAAGYPGAPMHRPPMSYGPQTGMPMQWPGHPMHMRGPLPAAGPPYQLVQQQGQHPRAGGPARRGGQGRGGRQGGNMGGMQRGQVTHKYADNVRNQKMPGGQGPPIQQQLMPQPEPQPGVEQAELSTAEFIKAAASLPDQKRKHVFGERLFPLVAVSEPDLAPKITGMLLEMDDTEIVELLESPQALEKKIQEALTVLQEAADSPQH